MRDEVKDSKDFIYPIKKVKEPTNRTWAPIDGHVWNPLLKFPRNKPCPCGTGLKFKHCHLPIISRAVPKDDVGEVAKFVKEVRKK